MPTRSTPPGLGLGSAAASLNFEPSNSVGTAAARLQRGDNPQAPAARAAPPLRTSRRVHHGRGNCASLIKFLLSPFGTGDGVSDRLTQNESRLCNGLSSPPRKRGSRACPWPEQGATAAALP